MIRARLLALALAGLMTAEGFALPPRWTPLRPHAEQSRYAHSKARFNVVPAGRRSGKTEILKRKVVRAALRPPRFYPGRYFLAAPTYAQAKRIFWDDLKALVPKSLLAGRPSESELYVELKNATRIYVLGMDKPARIEGSPWDGGGLDEYGNMKPEVWGANVRPALADRGGWCDFTGVPEGRNHYYALWLAALADSTGQWAAFTWKSADILPPEEIAAARLDLDPLVFEQEYEASFVSFEGRAYYNFSAEAHCAPLAYNREAPLIVCLDFNIAPGVAAIAQEQPMPRGGRIGTGIIGEVWIPAGSNTERVCRKILADWGEHAGPVHVYADATGGAGGSSAVQGSDLELVEKFLRRGFRGSKGFDDRLSMRVPSSNPAERARVNAVNTRLLNGADEVHMMVDASKAPHVVQDLDGVSLVVGGSGEIDKDPKKFKYLTHISDAIGYYIAERFPITAGSSRATDITL